MTPAALAEELREYTAMKYAGDCKCGKCQLVPRELVERIYHTLNGSTLTTNLVMTARGIDLEELMSLDGAALDARLREIGFDPADLLTQFNRVFDPALSNGKG